MISTCKKEQLRLVNAEESAKELSNRLNCPLLVATVLEMNGMVESVELDKARAILSPSLDLFLSLLDLGTGAERTAELWKEKMKGGNVVVYGDYDVDGISATTLAIELACFYGARVRYYIPHRQLEGYGVHVDSVERIADSGCDTMIVVDCGSRDIEAIAAARKRGMNVFVFDHHSVEGGSIKAETFVNPQQDGDESSRDLCATAVLWTWAWLWDIAPKKWLRQRLDLVAQATIADCMCLGPLNRAMVSEGMSQMRKSPRPGFAALCDGLGVSRSNINEETLAMRVIPCLNAPGRLDVADFSVNVMLSGAAASGSVERIIKLNRKRRDLSSTICSDITREMKDDLRHVVYNKAWPVGILSGVASRLCNEYSVPFALAAPGGDGIRGTLRMPEGGNAMSVLEDISEELLTWGGHRYAAGFTVRCDDWERVSCRLEGLLSEVEVPEIKDEVILMPPQKFDLDLWREIEQLGPFGKGNPAPRFYVRRNGDEKILPLGGKGLHVKIDLGGDSLLAFHGASRMKDLDDVIGWIYRPQINEWRGRTRLQFLLEKIVKS